MVKEFTNLQGIMGGLYAQAEGFSNQVAEAIYDHYGPSSMEASSPRNLVGAVLSVADKLDSVLAAFSVGVVPTGSRDPLALRRQTLGIAKVLLDKDLSVSMRNLVHKSCSLLRRFSSRSFDETYRDFEAFFQERIRYIFREQGYRYDEINAVVATGVNNPVDCWDRLKAIPQMRGSEDFLSLAVSFKRIKNILIKAGVSLDEPARVDPGLIQQDEEKTLYTAVEKIRPKIMKFSRSRQYSTVFNLMASFRPLVDKFFDKVLVMTEDETLQRNRLGIIGSLLQIFLAVADISEMVVG
jgi:glycyl-tRNA synthetase beta chain